MTTETKSDSDGYSDGGGIRGAGARGMGRAALRGLGLALVLLPGAVLCFTLSLVSIVLIPIGVGILTTGWVLTGVRVFADWRRVLAAEWCGVLIPSAYRPVPENANPWTRTFGMLRDPATWRDLRWLPVDMTAGFVTALLPAALLIYPLEGFALAAGLWRVFPDGYWYGFVPVTGQATAFAAGALGLGLLFLAHFFTLRLLPVHFRLTRWMLASNQRELAERVKVLTDTRRDAVDTSAAELRRIERDLHDGAQARLVAMGMDLGTIEMLLDKDPEQAKRLLSQARQSSADALTELRELVRGIHPPVLAERGLGDAVRALALRMPVPTETNVDLPGRAEAPVEAAAYFAVSEVLTNAVKHADADRIWIDLHHVDEGAEGAGGIGMLRISVTDNGKGGAAIGAGSGLAGVERRLGTFDGVLAVSSPAGGPTMVTLEIPCALS
ncbi:two-component system sensor kinase [Streptomyces lincolnensis]|uniref:histidine kinase n=1 Tax=Streptomyces lincolnensis TaxID=1915 RepID=A0A1B1M7Z9_STRLN|nr:sensor histidine kinase [Streptomyces lincolnensis]ANS64770.1 two-component system sensor kinase [Streptomyces lincolnensis]AXG57023.1 two-component system sensor kinase [Streptomyces lincolnensis]QMV06576.1 sensor histidine kinase [Streptomyces lincolnensis]